MINQAITDYNLAQEPEHQGICEVLAAKIQRGLPKATNKIWHGHPVWFLDDNPVVGYSPRKDGTINVMFWSGQTFDEPVLKPEGTFKAAEVRYRSVNEINAKDLQRWLKKSESIQWDYKNIVKRQGALERLK